MHVFILVENHFLSLISSRSIGKLKARVTKKEEGKKKNMVFMFRKFIPSSFLKKKDFFFSPTTLNVRI